MKHLIFLLCLLPCVAYAGTASVSVDTTSHAITYPNDFWTANNGVQTIQSYADPAWITSLSAAKLTGSFGGTIPFSQITSTPTTVAGYGITDAYTKTESDARFAPIGGGGGTVAWSNVTGTPTTLAGYGITDAYTKTLSDARYFQTSTAGTGVTSALTHAVNGASGLLALDSSAHASLTGGTTGNTLTLTAPTTSGFALNILYGSGGNYNDQIEFENGTFGTLFASANGISVAPPSGKPFYSSENINAKSFQTQAGIDYYQNVFGGNHEALIANHSPYQNVLALSSVVAGGVNGYCATRFLNGVDGYIDDSSANEFLEMGAYGTQSNLYSTVANNSYAGSVFAEASNLTGEATGVYSGCTLTNGSAVIQIPATYPNIHIGCDVAVVSGTGTIPANTTVIGYNKATGQATLSANVTASGTATVSFYNHGYTTAGSPQSMGFAWIQNGINTSKTLDQTIRMAILGGSTISGTPGPIQIYNPVIGAKFAGSTTVVSPMVSFSSTGDGTTFANNTVKTMTGTTTTAGTTISSLSNPSAITVGDYVAGSGISGNVQVTAVNVAGSSCTVALSPRASITGATGTSLSFSGPLISIQGNFSGITQPLVSMVNYNGGTGNQFDFGSNGGIDFSNNGFILTSNTSDYLQLSSAGLFIKSTISGSNFQQFGLTYSNGTGVNFTMGENNVSGVFTFQSNAAQGYRFNSGAGSNIFSFTNTGAVTAAGSVTGTSFLSPTGTPSAANGTNATTTITGTNQAGTIQVVLSGASSGVISTITLANALAYPTKAILMLTPANSAAADIPVGDGVYATGTATTGVINSSGTPLPAGTYLWNYSFSGY